MLTQKEKASIIKALKMVDVKRLEIEHEDEEIIKWFRFGSHSAMQIAVEIVSRMPETKNRKKVS